MNLVTITLTISIALPKVIVML